MDLAQTVTCQTRLRVGKDRVEHQKGSVSQGISVCTVVREI